MNKLLIYTAVLCCPASPIPCTAYASPEPPKEENQCVSAESIIEDAPRVLCVTHRGEELVVSAATIGDIAEQFELFGNGTNYYLSHRVTLYRDGSMYTVNVCCPKGRAVALHDGDILKIRKAALERRRCAGEENGHTECDEPRLVASLYDREYWLAKKHRLNANAEYMSLLSEEGYYFQIEEYESWQKRLREEQATRRR